MGFLTSIILGLLVGALAKWIMPGKDPGGLFVTMVLGIAGAMIGGWIGTQLGIGDVTGFNLVSIGLATLGAIIL
ncbi:MAG: GlsB/YeaQ/YmgE family stress response membrane protein, partial [Gammaproteobacteria bacterium]